MATDDTARVKQREPAAPADRAGCAEPERADEEPAEPERLDVEVAQEGETEQPPELDPETRARRDAALARVRKLGDPVLRATALPVQRFDRALSEEIEEMGRLMGDALGVGLAATQLGVLHRVLVYRADPEDEITALVNPVLEWASEEKEIGEEGCLSLPGVHVEVERPGQVRVRARDAAGQELEVQAEGLAARVIQHEIDHLDGVLILDRISRQARKEAMRALREAIASETAA
ncbi:MAG TPA: peptide deformylase [Solirubrobacteraceae bacterium]|nr:peptide deformylase [Solirubrobacteraceae bacterium]